MPMTPEEAAQLTEEEEEMLSELEDALNDVLHGVYNPLDPAWSVRLPLDLLIGLDLSNLTVDPDSLGATKAESEIIKQALLGRIGYLRALLVSRFDEKGWDLLINDDQKFFEITRKPDA